MTQLVWFRNDLRTTDHQALETALANAHKAGTKCVAAYIHCPKQLSLHGAGEIKQAAIRVALSNLKATLNKHDIQLLEHTVDSWAQCATLLAALCTDLKVETVHCHYEPGYDEYHRDKFVAEALKDEVSFNRYNDLYFVHPKALLNNQGEPYKVYSAYRKALFRKINETHWAPTPSCFRVNDHAEDANDWENPLKLAIDERSALKTLEAFLEREPSYCEFRDIPSEPGTSQLSVALSLGTISSRTIAKLLAEAGIALDRSKYFDEVLWREFYNYILHFRPELCLGRPFNARWDAFPWLEDPKHFDAWAAGQTGVPIVDAAMRQLNQTGWMHNRLRMVTAMYLVKILQQDWRKGERYFANKLADFDFAANNGGWQWVASTGVDAVPYFRIFNPYQQSKKFDPEGSFIRKYVPEIAAIDSKSIHQPPENVAMTLGYCKPLVDYASMRSDTLTKFKQL